MPAFDKNLQMLTMIMLFYSIITFFLFPYIGFYLMKSDGIMYGMAIGALLSIYLWKVYGQKASRL